MTGERATELYVEAALGVIPKFNDDSELEYYNKIVEEINEAKEKYGQNIMFEIPND